MTKSYERINLLKGTIMELGEYRESYQVSLNRMQMNNKYEVVAKFVRWIIIGLTTLVIAVPLLISIGA